MPGARGCQWFEFRLHRHVPQVISTIWATLYVPSHEKERRRKQVKLRSLAATQHNTCAKDMSILSFEPMILGLQDENIY